jgi:tRNA(Phe) wybutosine-synthesizing methylase Tyw3
MKERKPDHEQVEVILHGEKCEVDRNVAPLVMALSKLSGIFTSSSCEDKDGSGFAYVNFYVMDEAGQS